jgi:hypothetical protein
MVGVPSAAGSGAVLERLLFPEAQDEQHAQSWAAEQEDSSSADLLPAWAGLREGPSDSAYAAWRAGLARGLKEGPEGRGSWDTWPEGLPHAAPRAGVVLAALVYGLLGLHADAPAGRIGVAPRLPGHVGAFGVRGIPVGDARLRLDYARSGDTHRFELSLSQGREPPMAILAPTLPCRHIAAVRVDGRPAELDVVPHGEGVRVLAQLPVDGPRVLEVDCA